jgi:hypothetical protein
MLERFDPATLDPEDVEDDDIHVKLSNNGLLEDDDLLQFISVYFSDEYGTKNRTEPPDTGICAYLSFCRLCFIKMFSSN